MSEPAGSTVGEVKRALSSVTGIEPARIRHYAMVIDTDDGTILKFCCDDRQTASLMLAAGGELLVSVRGEPLHPGTPIPPMAGDS